MEQSNNTVKGFFKKPEGITGMIFIAAVGSVVIWSWGTILPFLIRTAQNTLHLAALLAVLGLIVYALLDSNLRTGFWYLFKMGCRAITGAIVTLDPIKVLKIYIRDLEVKREETSRKIDEVAGAAEKVKAQIMSNLRESELNKKRYEEGVRQGMEPEALTAYQIRFKGLGDMNEKLAPFHDQLIHIQAFLEKMYKSSGYLIEQMKVNVELKETEYKAIRAASSAMKSAMAIFKGDPDKKAIFDMALETMADDMALKVGEMKRAMNMSTEYLNSINIDQGVASKGGLDAMKTFDPKKFTLLTVSDVNKANKSNPNTVVPQITTSGKSTGMQF